MVTEMFTSTHIDDFQITPSSFIDAIHDTKGEYIIVQDGADTGLVKSSSISEASDSTFLNMLLDEKSGFVSFDASLAASISTNNVEIAPQVCMPPSATPTPIVTIPMPELGSDVLDPFAEYPPAPPAAQFFPMVSQQMHFSPQPELAMSEMSLPVHVGLPMGMNMGVLPHMIAAQVPHMTVNPSIPTSSSNSQRRLQKRKNGRDDSGDETGETDLIPLSAEMKKQRRLEKNREAAQQFRQRQKTYTVELNTQVSNLMELNKDMQERLSFLAGENLFLKEQLTYMRHFVNQAMSFKGPDSPSGLLAVAPCGIASQ